MKDEEGTRPEMKGYGALPPWGSLTPRNYTLKALKPGAYVIDYLYFSRPEQVHNADRYQVKVAE